MTTTGAPETITAALAEDAWVCICGNEPHLDGFYAYADGHEVEPTPEDWDGVHYFCASCFRVIDQNTLAVVAHPTSVEFL